MARVGFVSILIDYEKELLDKRIFSSLIPDYIEDPNWAKFDIPFRSIKATRESRKKSVIENIQWANENKVDLLLFPGWTLSHPGDLNTISKKVGKNLHVVLEICEGAVEYRNSINDEDRKTFQSRNFYDDAGVFVLSNEEVSKGPIFQLFSEGKKQICKKSNSGFIDQLKAELGRDCVWDQSDYDSEHRGFAQGRWLEIGKNGSSLFHVGKSKSSLPAIR